MPPWTIVWVVLNFILFHVMKRDILSPFWSCSTSTHPRNLILPEKKLRLYQPAHYRMLGCICLAPSGIVIPGVFLMSENFLGIEDKIMSLLKQSTKILFLFVELAFYLNFSTYLHLGYAPKHTENRWENHSTCLYLKFPIYATGWIIYTSVILKG